MRRPNVPTPDRASRRIRLGRASGTAGKETTGAGSPHDPPQDKQAVRSRRPRLHGRSFVGADGVLRVPLGADTLEAGLTPSQPGAASVIEIDLTRPPVGLTPPRPSPLGIVAAQAAPHVHHGTRIRDARGFLGTVRFVGFTDFHPGEWVGIELDGPHGKNDGAVDGVRYFWCADGHGRFVRPHKVWPLAPAEAEQSQGSSPGPAEPTVVSAASPEAPQLVHPVEVQPGAFDDSTGSALNIEVVDDAVAPAAVVARPPDSAATPIQVEAAEPVPEEEADATADIREEAAAAIATAAIPDAATPDAAIPGADSSSPVVREVLGPGGRPVRPETPPPVTAGESGATSPVLATSLPGGRARTPPNIGGAVATAGAAVAERTVANREPARITFNGDVSEALSMSMALPALSASDHQIHPSGAIGSPPGVGIGGGGVSTTPRVSEIRSLLDKTRSVFFSVFFL